MFVALLLSGIIGFERERAHKSAGMRTHALVALGSALFAVIAAEAFPGQGILIADIIVGIGFIGGAAITRGATKHLITGATTASSLWLAAGIGIAAGLGYNFIAVAATMIGYIVLTVFWHIEKKIAWRMGYGHLKMMDQLGLIHEHNAKRKKP
ncbi:MAG: putative Mg2+ transporter-C (MgtC) family protein [Parcubacteria group bacterium Licking1014_17]|nr:MAG: putative Mg2+ transporter-C (MgtC) family protein [Parcubacteria group bacterium Licking1014_17]